MEAHRGFVVRRLIGKVGSLKNEDLLNYLLRYVVLLLLSAKIPNYSLPTVKHLNLITSKADI